MRGTIRYSHLNNGVIFSGIILVFSHVSVCHHQYTMDNTTVAVVGCQSTIPNHYENGG